MRSLHRAALGAFVGLAGLLIPLAGPVQPVFAANAPKVVIIVGPVGGTTASYKADADNAAAEALNYTPNVVKLYSPTATWDVVKPALQGASIVIYMGHGNGFPSPYSTTLQPDRQNGLGLNPSAGTDDTTTKYWGEKFVAGDVKLAPNAVVILAHLCYASGSSEPGKPEPTLEQAQQRVDNFAAGFLAAGARAVIAEAYGGSAATYVSALFTAHNTVGNIWAMSPSAQGNTFSFASARTPGMTAQMDPDHGSQKYYRSIVGDLSLASDAVIGSSGEGPATPTPGSAPSPSSPISTPTPPAATPTPTPTPSAPLSVVVGDDTKVDVVTRGITLTRLTASTAFSPNGDGVDDTFGLHAQLSSPATWQLAIYDQSGLTLAGLSGAGDAIDVDWDGTFSGSRLPDGSYTYRLLAVDPIGGSLDRTARVRIDTVPPTFRPTAPSGSLSPNGDAVSDTWIGTFAVSEPVAVQASVLAADGTLVRQLAGPSAGTTATVIWDGKTDAGLAAPDGHYVVTARAQDGVGNAAPSVAVSIDLSRVVSKVAASASVFYPQDRDVLAPSTNLSFVLQQPATVTWTIVDARGRTVATRYADAALAAGRAAWAWNGIDETGRFVPAGAYASLVTATSGDLTTTARMALTVAAFRISVLPATPTRGQSVTVTAVSAEPLSANPRLTISQPGIAARSVAMVKVSANTYRVTTKLSAAGSAGTLTLKVSGTDTGRGVNVATTTAPLR